MPTVLQKCPSHHRLELFYSVLCRTLLSVALGTFASYYCHSFAIFFLFFKCLPCVPLLSHLALFSLTRLKVPPPQDYMAHHRGAYDKYSAGLSDKYNEKYSEGLAAKYNDKYAPRSSSSIMPSSTDSMVGFMAKYK